MLPAWLNRSTRLGQRFNHPGAGSNGVGKSQAVRTFRATQRTRSPCTGSGANRHLLEPFSRGWVEGRSFP
jgi:hypothetical protein